MKEETSKNSVDNGIKSQSYIKDTCKTTNADLMSDNNERNIFSYKQRNIRTRRSMSETSVYRANSRYTLKTGVNQSNKTLDRLMQCFWVCSPGCQQTIA